MTEWVDEVLDRPALVRQGLREVGYDAKSIEAFAAEHAALRHSPLPRTSKLDRLRALLGRRKYVTEETFTVWVNVPLYRFGAPPVEGAKVEYSEGESIADGSGWNIKFRGVGIGSTASLEVTKTCTFVASGGATKQVFVPVLVRVSRVAIHEGDRVVGRGHVAEVAPAAESGDPLLRRRGVRSVEAVVLGERPSEHHGVVDLALTADTSGALHKEKRSWVSDVGREVSVPLGPLVDVSALAKVKRTRRLELSFELPAGHHYRAYLCNGYTWWESPSGSVADRKSRVALKRRKAA